MGDDEQSDMNTVSMDLATNTEQKGCEFVRGLAEASEIEINAAGGSIATGAASVATSADQINFFSWPSSTTLNCFFKFQPNQLANNTAVMKAFSRKHGSQHRWVSYSAEKYSLFSAVCLVD